MTSAVPAPWGRAALGGGAKRIKYVSGICRRPEGSIAVYQKIKRGLDCFLACMGILVLSPVFLVLAAAIKMDSRGPVFFRQKRIGIHKKRFYILKFRTMRTDTPKDMPTHLLKNPEAYITKVGRFLRKTSLDELPQIINIIKGDMAIVGPRPALWNQDDLVAERDKYGANDIMPGLTGWAQINGRDELPIDVKARLDGEYVERMGLGMDIKCIVGTVFSVVRQEGVVEGGTGALEAGSVSVGEADGTGEPEAGSGSACKADGTGEPGAGNVSVGEADGMGAPGDGNDRKGRA